MQKRSIPERMVAHQLPDAAYEPCLIPYQALYKPDFILTVKEVEIIVEVKATATAAVRKQLKEISKSLISKNFIVAVFCPSLQFRFRVSEDFTGRLQTSGVLSGKMLCRWLHEHGIKWIEFSQNIQLTEERLHREVTRRTKRS